jgi:hypothetical protein
VVKSAFDATGNGTEGCVAMTPMHSGAEGHAGAGAVKKQLMRHATRFDGLHYEHLRVSTEIQDFEQYAMTHEWSHQCLEQGTLHSAQFPL